MRTVIPIYIFLLVLSQVVISASIGLAAQDKKYQSLSRELVSQYRVANNDSSDVDLNVSCNNSRELARVVICKVREEPALKRLNNNQISLTDRSHLSSWTIAFNAESTAFRLYGFKEGDEFNDLISGLHRKISSKDQAFRHVKLYLSLVSNDDDLRIVTSRQDLLIEIRRMQPAIIPPALEEMLGNKNRRAYHWTPTTAILSKGFEVSFYELSRLGSELRLQRRTFHISRTGAIESDVRASEKRPNSGLPERQQANSRG